MKPPTDATSAPPVEIALASAADQPILANLLELYAHDFSEFHSVEISSDGRFHYNELPLYFTDPARIPLLIRVGGKLAGFAFVRKGSRISNRPEVWDMAEFFILRAWRRRGIGARAAALVFRRFPGVWEVRAMHANPQADPFWQKAISGFAGEPVRSVPAELHGTHWQLFTFTSPRASES